MKIVIPEFNPRDVKILSDDGLDITKDIQCHSIKVDLDCNRREEPIKVELGCYAEVEITTDDGCVTINDTNSKVAQMFAALIREVNN